MSRRSTKQRRAARRRRLCEKVRNGTYFDTWKFQALPLAMSGLEAVVARGGFEYVVPFGVRWRLA
jgi:hypothetical protein